MILDLLASASVARFSGLTTPAQWLLEALGSEKTASGIRVNEQTAWNYAAVYCAVNVISGAIKRLPLITYRDRDGGGKDRAADHPVYDLLKRRPNDEMTPAYFKSYMQTSALLWDAGYAEISRDRAGMPRGVHPIHPDLVRAVRLEDDSLAFEVRNAQTNELTTVANDNLIRVYGPSRDGISGVSIRKAASEAIALGMATEQHGATFFGNGARPGGVIRHPGVMGDDEYRKFKRAWNQAYGGVKQSNKTAILQEGMEYQIIGLPNEVSQFLETRQFQIQEIARWFNLPPHKLKDLARATFSNIENQELEFLGDTILPWLVVWEDEFNRKLFGMGEEALFVKFSHNALLRADSATRSDYYSKMHRIGVYTINEIRAFDELNPIGPNGDRHFVEVNLVPLDRVDDKLANDQMSNRDKEFRRAWRRILRDAYGRIVAREIERIRRGIRKHHPDYGEMTMWLDEFYATGHESFARMTLEPVVRSLGVLCGSVVDLDATMSRYRSSADQFRDQVYEGKSWEHIHRMLETWERTRADELTDAEFAALLNGSNK